MSKSDKNNKSNKMWGGRFSSSPHEMMEKINASISYDMRFYAVDIKGSIAHCEMLAEVGIIKKAEAETIKNGLLQVKNEIERDEFEFSTELEDIHMNIEARLHEIIGDVAGKLHTARSRNDQVATDFRLYIRDYIDELSSKLIELMGVFVNKAEAEASTVMPGFTHLQVAQPVSFGHHCLAYVEMFNRDYKRLKDLRKRLNEMPLGAAALAGTAFPLNRSSTAKSLKFKKPMANSLDAVSDRDFVIELLSCLSMMGLHISRIAEEIIIWSSAQFNFIKLSDQFSTGSSIMPQKRNPDAAELLRGKTGRLVGALNQMMLTMKGLPLAYSKDMQEDKELSFDAMENAMLIVEVLSAMFADIKVNRIAMKEAANSGFSTATDIADWLVRELDIPFRKAHHITGAIVQYADENNKMLDELDITEFKNIESNISEDIFNVLSVENSMNSRKVYGGTAAENVLTEAKKWKKWLKKRAN